ncbi:MAG: AmmeMemoRadiSam system protein A [Clostridiales bacterium]|nr:AmmeMemoRadiSam system protein A [Clostridiales bacterium]
MGKLLKTYLMPHPPIMVHEVGRGEEGEIISTVNSAGKVAEEIGKLRPDVIIILVPPHGPSFYDAMSINTGEYIKGNLGRFGAYNLRYDYKIDSDIVSKIIGKSAENHIPTASVDEDTPKRYRIPYELDHGSMVPLYFVNQKYRNYKLVHITYGLLSNEELYEFGRIVREAVEECGENAVYIASGDLSHRLTHDAPAGFSPRGHEFDEKIVEYLRQMDVDAIMNMDADLTESAGECGYRSIITAMGTLDGYDVKSHVYSYEGPFGVGYCIAGFDMLNRDDKNRKVDDYFKLKKERVRKIREKEDEYVSLARQSLEHYIREGKVMDIPDSLPPEMTRNRSGVFVSLKKNGQLRGCIGTIEGVRSNIAEEIIRNAISAGTQDPRFYPVEEEELDQIIYSVDILKKSMPVRSKDELDVKKYGIIVRCGRRSGLLLPNIEGVDTVDDQISIALQKGRIDEEENYSMEKFEVTRHR